MTCQSQGPRIGVINCGCRGDVDTTIYRCESFDTATHFCVALGPGEQTKEVKLDSGEVEQLTFTACNRCPFNSDKKPRKRVVEQQPKEEAVSQSNSWETYAKPWQIDRKRKRG